MAEDSKDNQEYQFLKETIVPKKKNKIVKRICIVVFVIFLAAVFGLVAEIVMLTSEDYLREVFGIEEGRHEVGLPKSDTPVPTSPSLLTPSPTGKASPVPKATNTPVPTPTTNPVLTQAPENPDATPVPTAPVTPEPSREPQELLTPTPEAPEPTKSPEDPDTTPDIGTQELAYLQLYKTILEVAEEVSSSMVVVEAIETGVDWFQEVYETRTKTSGLILANDGIDLLILIDTERISAATSIEVYFGNEAVEGRIYALDKSYGLAVVAVPLSQISDEVLESITIGTIADESDIRRGTPVLALGAPNGYENSMEFGMITSMGGSVSVTDGQVSYFTTDINDQPSGYGFVVNLEGEFMGILTHTQKANPGDGIFTAISLDAIRDILVKLLNNAGQVYFGVKGQDLPQSVIKNSGVPSGLYVSEVENSSPALNAGLKAGDIIVSVGGKPIAGIRDFMDILSGCNSREILVVKLKRWSEDGLREMTVEVSLTEKK